MGTTASPACFKIVAGKSKDGVFWREHSFYKLSGRDVGFFSSNSKHGRVGFLHLVRNNYKGCCPVLASSKSQADLETGETKNRPISESETVRVRFLLQKECAFGDQFLLVGDDPTLGSWDPESAVPLNWSDGHVWVVELDAPVEKSIQYKFLLKEFTGKVTWQPEPDRIIQTWNTANTIVIFEDWDDAALQKIVEEQPQDDQNAESAGSSEILIEADHKEESVPLESEKTTIGDENPPAAKNASLSSAEEQIVVVERQVAIVADNISYPQQNPEENATGHDQDHKRINGSTNEPMTTADKNVVAGKELMASNGQATVGKSEIEEDVNGSLFVHEGDPVLVPGLIPVPSLPSEVALHEQDESKKSTDTDASLGVNDTENHDIPETTQADEKHEAADGIIIHDEQPDHEAADGIIIHDKQPEETAQMVSDGHHLKSEIKQAPAAKQESKQEVSDDPESTVLRNDIQWGRQTLQKLLSSLGFM